MRYIVIQLVHNNANSHLVNPRSRLSIALGEKKRTQNAQYFGYTPQLSLVLKKHTNELESIAASSRKKKNLKLMQLLWYKIG